MRLGDHSLVLDEHAGTQVLVVAGSEDVTDHYRLHIIFLE